MDPKAAAAAAATARDERSRALLQETKQEVCDLKAELEIGELHVERGVKQHHAKLRSDLEGIKAKLAPVNCPRYDTRYAPIYHTVCPQCQAPGHIEKPHTQGIPQYIDQQQRSLGLDDSATPSLPSRSNSGCR